MEETVLDKALSVINEALDGKVVNPVALNTAISMTQLLWSSVYAERVRVNQITEALRHKWSDTIPDEKEKNQ